MRNLKVLGVALLAMFSLSAMLASAASADDQVTAEEYPATLTGSRHSGTDTLVTTAGNISCTTANYHGTLAKASTTVTVTPSYSGCTAFGFPAVIDMNGCDYELHMTAGEGTEAGATVLCPAGQEITVTAISAGTTKCTVHVKPQTVGGDVKITNTGSGSTRELTLHLNFTNIHYTHTEGTGLGKCPSGTGAAGTITALATVTGENDPPPFTKHIGIFMSKI